MSVPKDANENNLTQEDELDLFDQEINRSDLFAPIDFIEDQPIPTTEEISEDITIDDTTYTCRSTQYKVSSGHTTLYVADPVQSVIYPGAIFSGNSILNGSYQPLIAERRPLNISISIHGADEVTRTIDNLTLSRARKAINELLLSTNLNRTKPPADFHFRFQEIHNESQFSSTFGLNIKGQLFPAIFKKALSNLSLEAHTKSISNSYAARFIHNYYTIDIDLPNKPSSFFRVRPDIPDNISPVYVSSVTYGRMVLFSLQSKKTKNEMELALKNSIDVANNIKVSNQVTIEDTSLLDESNIQVSVIGGDGSSGGAIYDTAGLLSFLKKGSNNYQDGKLLSYTLRFLKNNSVATVVLSSDYNIQNCEPRISEENTEITLKLDSILSSNELGSGLDIYGTVGLKIVDAIPGIHTCSFTPNPNDETQQHGILANIAEENLLNLQTGWNDLSHFPYQSRIQYTKEDFDMGKNLEICVNMCDQDILRDDCINQAYVVQINDILGARHDQLIGTDNGFIFKENDTWIRLKVKRQIPSR